MFFTFPLNAEGDNANALFTQTIPLSNSWWQHHAKKLVNILVKGREEEDCQTMLNHALVYSFSSLYTTGPDFCISEMQDIAMYLHKLYVSLVCLTLGSFIRLRFLQLRIYGSEPWLWNISSQTVLCIDKSTVLSVSLKKHIDYSRVGLDPLFQNRSMWSDVGGTTFK